MSRLLRLPHAAQTLALAGAILLIASLWLPWYGATYEVSQGRVSGAVVSGDDDAWSFLSMTDIARAAGPRGRCSGCVR